MSVRNAASIKQCLQQMLNKERQYNVVELAACSTPMSTVNAQNIELKNERERKEATKGLWQLPSLGYCVEYTSSPVCSPVNGRDKLRQKIDEPVLG